MESPEASERLEGALARLARTPVLLVVSDFDGTLAPIVEVPDEARALPQGLRALNALARQSHCHAAIVSGRALADLRARLPDAGEGLLMVGSHGSEFEPGLTGRLDAAQRQRLARARAAMEAAVEGLEGLRVEPKDASVALHYRQAGRLDAARAIWRLRRALAGERDGLELRRGKKVVEIGVPLGDKGRAIGRLRGDLGATGLLYLGDDRTDEDAFAALRAEDLGVKVGPGPSLATHRLPDPAAVADLLARLSELRHEAVRDAVSLPLTELGFLSDQATGALVSSRGEVCWLCPGRFDRPALFASLLGGPTAGRFVIRPADRSEPGRQRYLEGSLVLETSWPELRLFDYLDPEAATQGSTVLVRELLPAPGGARCAIELAPGPDFARMDARIRPMAEGLEVQAGAEPILLTAPRLPWVIDRVGHSDRARVVVSIDAPMRLELRVGPAGGPASSRESVVARWAAGLAGLVLPTLYSDRVARSVLTLRGLIHHRSGAMVAALTTSLPEALGAERNWDYRYCWLRDAALACDALLRLGSRHEARAFLDWLCRIAPERPSEHLQPLYGVEGETNLVEAELGHLLGYASSQPVRVGNAAADQLQVDVYGILVELVETAERFGMTIEDRHWSLVRCLVEAVGRRWQEPDAGIWEHRHLHRPHLHSKVMAWVAVDRALQLARRSGREPEPSWPGLREAIRAEVLERGFDASVGAFTVAYGARDFDAAALHVLLSGLLPADDPRAVATVEAVAGDLGRHGHVYRYRFDDGFSGDEGAFHICTSWLVDALVRMGRLEEARQRFELLLGASGPTGLLSEEVDPHTGRALGNLPQAYTHTGLIWNALALSGDRRARAFDGLDR